MSAVVQLLTLVHAQSGLANALLEPLLPEEGARLLVVDTRVDPRLYRRDVDFLPLRSNIGAVVLLHAAPTAVLVIRSLL